MAAMWPAHTFSNAHPWAEMCRRSACCREIAFKDLFPDVGGLSFDKHGSHVVEKVIWNKDTKRPATSAQLDALWVRLFADTGNKDEPGPLLDRLIPHEYGNYVVSSCLEVSLTLPKWHAAPAHWHPAELAAPAIAQRLL